MTGGLFEMYGGKITYNTSASTSSCHGGRRGRDRRALLSYCTAVISPINKANGEYGEGGGVYVKNGTFEMSGGNIEDNFSFRQRIVAAVCTSVRAVNLP